MRNKKACFSHQSDIWETPKEIYEGFKERDYFDPCPINPTFDGLQIEWKLANFVNPPYSQISKWVSKAIKEHKKWKKVVLLVPARTDTKWFKEIFYYGANFYFIRGRLKFSGKGSAPFPSVLIELTGNESRIQVKDKEYYSS